MAAVPPTDPNQWNADFTLTNPLLEILLGARSRLGGKVISISSEVVKTAEGKPDGDHNHKIWIEIKAGEKEPISLFALNLNGKRKKLPDAISELVAKIESHLTNRLNPDLIKLSSGAMIQSKLSIPIKEEQGYLSINGKIVVVKVGDKFMPLPGSKIQTYTIFQATQDGNLIILSDEHDRMRDDPNKGFFFNTQKPLSLTPEQLKTDQPSTFPAKAEYLFLYRNKEDALRGI